MASRIGLSISLVICSITSFGCVGQNKQAPSIHTVQVIDMETKTHRCLGSVCGDFTLFSQWTLGNDSISPFGQTTREGFGCLGSVCGPDAMSPTWILVQPENTCLSTVCGSNLANSLFGSMRNRLAWVCQAEPRRR
jgi:hypothetical protein